MVEVPKARRSPCCDARVPWLLAREASWCTLASMSAPARPLPEAAYDQRGVDRSLVRFMLSLTPAQRLEIARQRAERLLELRAAFERTRAREPRDAPGYDGYR